MPEAAAWRFQKVLKPLFDVPVEHRIFKGTVLTCVGDEVIENGFVEIEDGKIKAVGRADDLGATASDVVEIDGTILPGLFQNHAHLAWDGIHDLANQGVSGINIRLGARGRFAGHFSSRDILRSRCRVRSPRYCAGMAVFASRGAEAPTLPEV